MSGAKFSTHSTADVHSHVTSDTDQIINARYLLDMSHDGPCFIQENPLALCE